MSFIGVLPLVDQLDVGEHAVKHLAGDVVIAEQGGRQVERVLKHR